MCLALLPLHLILQESVVIVFLLLAAVLLLVGVTMISSIDSLSARRH